MSALRRQTFAVHQIVSAKGERDIGLWRTLRAKRAMADFAPEGQSAGLVARTENATEQPVVRRCLCRRDRRLSGCHGDRVVAAAERGQLRISVKGVLGADRKK